MRLRFGIFVGVLLLLSSFAANAQEAGRDSLIRLVYADQAQQVFEYGLNYRRVWGNAEFLHNNAHLYCDSASWNIDWKCIDAYGNVRIVQDNTMLKSEQLRYDIEENMAHFNGGVVELIDKDGHVLRTMQLDYNTKDSVGFFHRGGSMKDSEGNVIESRDGTYTTNDNTFVFEHDVEMYMDSIRILTTKLIYNTDSQVARFGEATNMWKDDGFLYADDGWYDRNGKEVHFSNRVYMNDPSYEAWSDDVNYDQKSGEINMYRNSQILDTTHKAYYTANHIRYERDTVDGVVTMTEEPAIIFCGENENKVVDTLYFGADTLVTFALRKNDIPAEEIAASKQRYEDITYDTLKKKREELAAEREKKKTEKMRDAGKLPPTVPPKGKMAKRDSTVAPVPDSLLAMPGSSMLAAADSVRTAIDSVGTVQDSSSAVIDTTHIRMLYAYHNVKAYRSDIQARCDTVIFSSLDSIARMYGTPIMWNEVKNQLTAETMNILIRNGGLDRSSMVTDSWIISQEDSVHFNQIKSTEMMGYFHDNQLYRFDALGGVNALFYLDEKGSLTTVNLKEAKSMTALVKDGNAQRILYMETVKSDAYPILELEAEKHRLKDFVWRGEERPVSSAEITHIRPNISQREKYARVAAPMYDETNLYFDNYMKGVLDSIEAQRLARLERKRVSDSLKEARRRMEIFEDSLANQVPVKDTTVASDTLKIEKIKTDTESSEKLSPREKRKIERAQKRALRKEERQARRQARQKARKERREARRAAKEKRLSAN